MKRKNEFNENDRNVKPRTDELIIRLPNPFFRRKEEVSSAAPAPAEFKVPPKPAARVNAPVRPVAPVNIQVPNNRPGIFQPAPSAQPIPQTQPNQFALTNFGFLDIKTSLFFTAVRYSRIEIVESQLNKGANPNVIDESGETPLHIAYLFGRTDVADLLIKRGANVNAINSHGKKPSEVVKIADFKVPNNAELEIKPQAPVAPKLIVNPTVTQASSPELHETVKSGKCGDVSALIEKRIKAKVNIEINAVDADGLTALHYAVKFGYKDIMALLIENKANVNAKDKEDNTPLHYTTLYNKGGDTLLIGHGADTKAINKEGKTPLDYIHALRPEPVESASVFKFGKIAPQPQLPPPPKPNHSFVGNLQASGANIKF